MTLTCPFWTLILTKISLFYEFSGGVRHDCFANPPSPVVKWMYCVGRT